MGTYYGEIVSLTSGMAWGTPLEGKPPTLKDSIQQATKHFKATRRRWPNFIRCSPADARSLGTGLNGLMVIADTYAGKSYRFLLGYSKEARR